MKGGEAMILSREKLNRLREAYRVGISVQKLADDANCNLGDAAYYVERKTLKVAVLALMLQGMTKGAIARRLAVSHFVLMSALRGMYDHF